MSGIDLLAVPTTVGIPTIAEVEADPIALNTRMGRFTYLPIRWVLRRHCDPTACHSAYASTPASGAMWHCSPLRPDFRRRLGCGQAVPEPDMASAHWRHNF